MINPMHLFPLHQILLVIGVVVVALGAQLYFMPFENDLLNNMEALSIFVTFATFFLSQFFLVPTVSKDMIAVFILLLNLAFVLLVVALLVWLIRQSSLEETSGLGRLRKALENSTAMARFSAISIPSSSARCSHDSIPRDSGGSGSSAGFKLKAKSFFKVPVSLRAKSPESHSSLPPSVALPNPVKGSALELSEDL